ncbi:MAG: DUF559 domain-containing protein [Candidatus Doudnabacteria bacterium]|nr:DUF559 domain-containing protein [Candidatus Doudnabacteria bacterium]
MVRPIPKNAIVYSRELRKNPTTWELKLWEHLKDKNLGVKFKRQVYIGGYVVDFCCNAKKLIVEVDGGHHRIKARKIQDQIRSKHLNREGYSVLRFWNSQIDKDINKVLETIINALS